MINPRVLAITPYQPGRPIEEVKRQLGLKKVIKLASNENPLGPSPKALRAVKGALIKVNRYPEGSCFYLRDALSKNLKVKPANLLFGNGSDEIIDIIIKACSQPEDEILTSQATFLEYRIIAQQNSRKPLTCALKNFKYDLDALLRKVGPKTRVIFIANPNNPTGTYLSQKETDRFLKILPPRVICVFDEAYKEFVRERDFPQSLNYIRKMKNVIILRTFSKIYGLAGLRIGYAIAEQGLISCLERCRQPFNVNSLAQAGALAALADNNFVNKTKTLIKEGREYLYGEFKKLGLVFIPSAANFILVDLRRGCRDACGKLLKNGIIVRDMKQYGLDNFIRVTIGKKKENREFISLLKAIK